MVVSILFGIRAFKTELNKVLWKKKTWFFGGANTTLSRLLFLFTVKWKVHEILPLLQLHVFNKN